MRAYSSVVTDEGRCCSFNIMPDYLMLKHGVAEVRRRFSITTMHEKSRHQFNRLNLTKEG